MISPEEAGKAGQNAVDALSRLEADMLIEAAAKLKASSLEGVDVSREAAELQATVREYARRDSNVAKALEQDIRGMLELDAGREAAAAGATPEQVATMATATEAAAQEAYREALRGASELAANMTADIRRQYAQMANAASLQVTSGNMARDEATAWATSKMAERGISALETTTASGVRRTPVDVAMRQVIQEALMRRLTKQVTDIAALCGEDLVEVSSHGGARPSHAKWQGKVYSLSGKSEKYPPFYERCMARGGDFYDPVDGYGGYNCRHTIGIYREGYHRRWQDDPLVSKGYDNDEVYALQQRQRRYENDIRKLKREKEVLESQGYDARAVNARIRGKQAQLRQLIAENDSVLSRERWREQVTRTATGAINAEEALVKATKGKQMFGVSSKVNSYAYRKAIHSAPITTEAAESVRTQAGRILSKAAGTQSEYMAAIDLETGELVADNLSRKANMGKTGFGNSEMESIRRHGKPIVIIHNHPSSGRPSMTDILTTAKDAQIYGSFVLGHDSSIWFVAADSEVARTIERTYNSLKGIYGDLARNKTVDALLDSESMARHLDWRKLR